jgi:hypothetical protein
MMLSGLLPRLNQSCFSQAIPSSADVALFISSKFRQDPGQSMASGAASRARPLGVRCWGLMLRLRVALTGVGILLWGIR